MQSVSDDDVRKRLLEKPRFIKKGKWRTNTVEAPCPVLILTSSGPHFLAGPRVDGAPTFPQVPSHPIQTLQNVSLNFECI